MQPVDTGAEGDDVMFLELGCQLIKQGTARVAFILRAHIAKEALPVYLKSSEQKIYHIGVHRHFK